uniref:NET domain-containing protein n=1 Tax=viral metagenome TaxID=1070528 RepID=A0A6C0D7E1_9ZZZZ
MSDDYEKRKQLLEEIKLLTKIEQEGIFRILKSTNSLYSENSNGIFFDLLKLNTETFDEMKQFLDFCKQNRQAFEDREKEERIAQEMLHN